MENGKDSFGRFLAGANSVRHRIGAAFILLFLVVALSSLFSAENLLPRSNFSPILQTMDADFKTFAVVIPFQGRKVKHLAGVFYDFTMSPETLCGQPTKAMGREPEETLFDRQADCQQCAGATPAQPPRSEVRGLGWDPEPSEPRSTNP